MAGIDPISAAFDLGGKLIDRLWQDPAKKAEAALELLKLQQSGELATMTAQTDINKQEAASQSIFVAGWRPFVGWVCGSGLAYEFILRPLIQAIVTLWIHGWIAPEIEMGQLFELLIGMLGLGTMRTLEKINGVTAGH